MFFEELGNRKIIFVFDNIDAYVEFENFQLIGTVEKLYKSALSRSHNSKFIFTCRSSINDIDTELLAIKLLGLTKEETLLLFTEYQLPIKNEEVVVLAASAFNLTKGHPLWLNLIAAQARRGLEIAKQFMTGITTNTNFQEDSLTSILSNKILNVIWNSLNDKQKTLLMAFAEIVRAETEETLSRILSSELNHNQFVKSFKALKLLNLIVIKSMIDEQDRFELHPLVKEYVIQNFGKVERSKFISLFVSFYDNIILILKPKLNSEQPLSFFENWTAKIELAVNNGDYKNALVVLEEIGDTICDAGYVEEYIRVSNLVFENVDWKTAINEEYSYFNTQFSKFVNTLTDFGTFGQASSLLMKYEKYSVNKGINYIMFCQTKAHFFWFQSQFDEAIKLAEDGLSLEEPSPTKSTFDLKHTLALALRDTKSKENISKAIELFLKGNELNEVVHGEDDLYISGEAYGNIGRCLQFLGNFNDAMFCYKKSLNKVKGQMNKGYGFLWYAECLINKNEIGEALAFYKQAFNTWMKISPIKSTALDKKIAAIIEVNPALGSIGEMTDKEIERFCQNIMSRTTLTKQQI